jgi:ATP-dependent helicase/nuclease subunit A
MTSPAFAMSEAAETQRAASDPRVSAFVSAHAGTGKTKLLVDRLLRLMLEGADPARILCLTYTKAAAAEMAIRLQKRLGGWVTLDDAALERELADLQVGPEKGARARALFADVLDLPGGMRIATIHAFCQSLLKRFPLEAQISPHFQLVEPSEARGALEEARETVLGEADAEALATLAGLVNAEAFGALAAALEETTDRLASALTLPPAELQAALFRAAGVTFDEEVALLAAAAEWPEADGLRENLRIVAEGGSDTVRARAHRMLDWLALPGGTRCDYLDKWLEEFFRADGKPRGLSIFANKKLSDKHPHIIPACAAEQTRLASLLDARRARALAAATAALLKLAGPILRLHAEGQERRAQLDYDDLIGRSFKLLDDEHIGTAWVLYKLDGGLDHLLLDEVQDTAPLQWKIADKLTADFFTGEGARQAAGLARTVFAVGDRKQSIYSFQGAAPEEFDFWRAVFAKRVRQSGLGWREVALKTSFRSTAPVLALVDAVFSGAEAEAGVVAPEEPPLHHIAHRLGQAGRVELWPLAPRPAEPEHTPWSIPLRNQAQISAPQTLVNELARWIAEQTRGPARQLRPGDILVLVRRRGAFASALVRALKSRDVPVAGLDRMVLTEQPAVQDLLSLCDALLLPQDDLSLAEMLVSPLGGLSDDSLMHLAAERTGTLWDNLRSRAGERPEWQSALDFFTTLLRRVDYAQPYALLSEALGPLGGRARLFARLGPEAAEPVDEFLGAALQHAAMHPPSLQGFLHWLRLSAAEVKREAEAAGDSVRIMTVHGSKGLEAPLVILPDTTSLPPPEGGLVWATDEQTGAVLPLWEPNAQFRCAAVARLRDAQAEKALQEYHRLLYVALTRARDRLLICGWEMARPAEGSWYDLVAQGFRALETESADFTAWPGKVLTVHTRDVSAGVRTAPSEMPATAAALPAWAGTAPYWKPAALPPEPPLPRPLAPSRPDGVALGPVPAAHSPLAHTSEPDRFARGLAMHALLQHLPNLPPDARKHAAETYATRPALGLAEPARLAAEALAVLDDPSLAPLFGPGSRAEQPLSGLVGPHVVSGQVDRLAILPDRVLIADYKTGRVPKTVQDVPVMYLRQMSAYRAVLALIAPGKPIECTLVWTDGPRIMRLSDDVLDRHAPGAARSPLAA